MFKQKITGFAFFRIGWSFFCLFFFFWFKKKNVGSGLILGSVGLRQYNNFFFWPKAMPGPMIYTLSLVEIPGNLNISSNDFESKTANVDIFV